MEERSMVESAWFQRQAEDDQLERQLMLLRSAPGRETAAGRALFALLRGYDMARQRGNEFSRHNAARSRLRRPSDPSAVTPPQPEKPKKPCPQKQYVKIPRFTKRTVEDSADSKLSYRAGRRKASDILKQLQNELEHKELPPYPTKPLLDDKEKARLALIFEWSGRLDEDEELALPPPTDQVKAASTAVSKVQKGSIEEMETMLEQISKEVADREEFMREMDRLGQAEKYKNQVQFEIQQRVKQMKKLDLLIREDQSC